MEKNYELVKLIHNPEFLREKTAINDTFFTNRIVIGSNSYGNGKYFIDAIYNSLHCPKVNVDLRTAEMIKQVSNAWLATQISFWNEIKTICDVMKINPQEISNAVVLDKRISKYESIMLGKPFEGKCLPKDLEHLIDCFKEQGLQSYIC